MPYRRLPNTDQARLRALKSAIFRCEGQEYGQEVVAFSTMLDAKNIARQFESQLMLYQQSLDNQVEANRQYQQALHNARMYVSHFIQVFNLSVIRGEIKAEHKLLYGLDPATNGVPDLSTEAAILQWGQRVIDGEGERVRKGGVQIYNPTISKVKVHYDIFKEQQAVHKLHQGITTRNREELLKLRVKCDELILSIWNQVEDKFRNTPDSLQRCREYGLVYYYRKGEEHD